MPWEARYLAQERVVETSYSGSLDPRELRDAIETTIRMAGENGTTRFLADLSTLEGGHSIVDLSESVARFEALGVARDMREALVLPDLASSSESARFYETACQNRGWNVRVFPDRTTALAWLTER
jgi:hypothetical protein